MIDPSVPNQGSGHFTVTSEVWLDCNHKPTIRDDAKGIWRCMYVSWTPEERTAFAARCGDANAAGCPEAP